MALSFTIVYLYWIFSNDHTRRKIPENELTALIALIRRVLEIDSVLTPYDAIVNRNFQSWVMGLHKGNGCA
jgi:type I restriction enzyme R subunit